MLKQVYLCPAGIQVCWDQWLWLRVCWGINMHREVVEHKLGSVAWQEDAEPGFAAAPGFPLLSGRA